MWESTIFMWNLQLNHVHLNSIKNLVPTGIQRFLSSHISLSWLLLRQLMAASDVKYRLTEYELIYDKYPDESWWGWELRWNESGKEYPATRKLEW
jgi:hypothetical protein